MIILMRTPVGRYQFWPALQIVDFVPKGKRRPTWSTPVKYNAHPFDAVRVALKNEGITLVI